MVVISCKGRPTEHTHQICLPDGQCPDIVQTAVIQPHAEIVPGDLERGGKLYKRLCADCHGQGGEGIREKGSRDHTDPVWQDRISDAQIQTAMVQGLGMKMPANPFLRPNDLKDLTAFIRSLRRTPAAPANTEE
tara:strand:+ start:3269 stop:3670 length:402 start_codon:yes stop_codon:yes gene_type:complete